MPKKKVNVQVLDEDEAPIRHEPFVNFLNDNSLDFLDKTPETLSEDAEELNELFKKHPEKNVEIEVIHYGKRTTYTPKKKELKDDRL